MDRAGDPEHGARLRRLLVEGDRFDDRRRQAPQAQQIGTGDALRQDHGGAALLDLHRRQQQPHLREQPGGAGQAGAGAGQQLRAQARDAHRALAHHVGAGTGGKHFTGQHQLAQRVLAQADDRRAQVADLAAAGVVGRVAQAQHPRGQRRVLRDHRHHVAGLGRRIAQHAGQGEVLPGRSRQRSGALDGLLQAGIVEQVAQRGHALDRLDHRRTIQRFGQHAMDHVQRMHDLLVALAAH